MSNSFVNTSNSNAQNQLVTWINDATMSTGKKKANILRKVIEYLMHHTPQSIPTYLVNILSWSTDKCPEVRKQIVFFIEELSKIQPVFLPDTVSELLRMLADSVIAVQKRVIQAASIVFRNALLWICSGEATVSDKMKLWDNISSLKLHIINMIDSENEGLRTQSVKFLEEVVLLQSHNDSGEPSDFNLEDIPYDLPFIKKSMLEKEAEHIFDLLLKFHNSQHISSVNLMACMTTLCNICKVRPKYMLPVMKALGDLHTTLPPTLSQSQVNSVRKHLKAHLIGLLKHPSSNDMFPQITQLLLDTGMSQSELLKTLPRDRRYKRLGEFKESSSKRIRIDSPQSNSQGSDSNSRGDVITGTPMSDDQMEINKDELSEDTVLEGLNNIENVVSLVMSTLKHNLPETMPLSFSDTYKPIPNAGSVSQKKDLAKLIFTEIKGKEIELEPAPKPVVSPYLSEVNTKIPLLKDDDEKLTLKNAVAKLHESTKNEKQNIESAVSKLMEETRQLHLKETEKGEKEKAKENKLIPPPTPTIPKLKQKVKLLKLQELTRPIPKEIKEKLIIQAIGRILAAETECVIGGATQVRAKLITTFASSYTPEIREIVLNYILEDPVNRMDLGMAWLYEEYAFMQNFNNPPVTLYPKLPDKCDLSYNNLLCALITQISERGDPVMETSKDVLLRRVFLEAPLITEEALDYLKQLVYDEKVSIIALELLEDLCLMRTPHTHKYVTALLSHTLNPDEEIREIALKSVLQIYSKPSEAVTRVIEKYAKVYLGFIALSSPPSDLFNEKNYSRVWTDELYKLCLVLIMALFPCKDVLIMEIARVYGKASADAKRCVLRAIEAPLRSLSSSPPRAAFLDLLEECPRGAETLLTRLIHILTEKTPPCEDLVSRVRVLYATRVSDVRFLIPVLNGLDKKEILAALPKLIKLNPIIVKEVFNKLLGLQSPTSDSLPVTSTELLVALHLIDPASSDLKYIIKATALCFAEKDTIYTQEVIAGVLQILVEEPEIPVLLMRSVLQALAIYPNLSGLVLNILQRLIEKEVWAHKVAWEGWLKCVERCLPQSARLVVGLPPAPYAAAITSLTLRHAAREYGRLHPHHLPAHALHLLEEEKPYVAGQMTETLMPPGME